MVRCPFCKLAEQAENGIVEISLKPWCVLQAYSNLAPLKSLLSRDAYKGLFLVAVTLSQQYFAWSKTNVNKTLK